MSNDVWKSHKNFDIVLENMGQGNAQPYISPTLHPLFTNHLIGLKRVERNNTTEINLVNYSWDRDEERDSP